MDCNRILSSVLELAGNLGRILGTDKHAHTTLLSQVM